MAYNKQTWLDGKSGNTPISAARLNYLEQGLADASTVETFTTTQRNALTAGQKWEGRVIYNSTTDRLQQWDGAAWFTVPIDTDISALLATAGTPSAPGTADRGSSTFAARADHVHAGPRGTLGYTQVTITHSGVTSGSNTDRTGLSVAVTVGAGRRIRITGFSLMSSTIAGDSSILSIMEGATQLQGATIDHRQAGTSVHVNLDVILTPGAGAHTYKLAIARAGGTGAISSVATANNPAFIHVEDTGI